MLLLKKKSKLNYLNYNFLILTRHNLFKNIKKQKSQNITLRSPKHFNVGKHKVYTLKYKFSKKFLFNNLYFNTKRLTLNTNEFFYFKHFIKTPVNLVRNINVSLKLNLKFEIKW